MATIRSSQADGGTKPKTKVKTISQNYPRNLQGAPMDTARAIMGLPASDIYSQLSELNKVKKEESSTPPASSTGGGSGGSQYASALAALSKLANQNASTINASQDALKNLLTQQVNPYAGYTPPATQTSPELAQFLQSQNVPDTALQQFAATINAQNAGQAGAYGNMLDFMARQQEAARTGQLADVEQQRGNLLQQLQGSLLGTGAAMIGKKNVDRNAITQMLLAALRGKA